MKIKRYSPRETPYTEMIALPDGEYVRHDDYVALELHNECLLARLRKQGEQLEAIGAGGVSSQRVTSQRGGEPVDPPGDNFGSAEHWKEKAQLWAGEAHRLRQQALKEAIAEATKISDKYAYGYSGHEVDAVDETIDAIRALIPKEPPCDT